MSLRPSSLIVLLWSVVAALNLGLSLIGPTHWIATSQVAVTSVCGIALSLVSFALTSRLAVARPHLALPLLAIVVVVSGTALWTVDVLVQRWTDPPGDAWLGAFLLRRYNWVYFTALFGLQAAVSALLASARTLRIREQQLSEARLEALRFQLNPHFLFNTLNAIATLTAEAGAREAEEMIVRLSELLRASLSSELTELIPLARELEILQAYLEIEAVRFGDRLVIRYACEAGLAEAQVPSLILQPLVENAVKYAVSPSTRPVLILIDARAADDQLILTIQDDGHAATRTVPRGTGIGLKNVAARLGTIYGAAGRLETRQGELGFTAVVRVPLRRCAAPEAT